MYMLLGWVLYDSERCDFYRSLVAFGVLKYKGLCAQLRLKRKEMLIKYLKRNASKNIQFDDHEEDWKVSLRRILESYVVKIGCGWNWFKSFPFIRFWYQSSIKFGFCYSSIKWDSLFTLELPHKSYYVI